MVATVALIVIAVILPFILLLTKPSVSTGKTFIVDIDTSSLPKNKKQTPQNQTSYVPNFTYEIKTAKGEKNLYDLLKPTKKFHFSYYYKLGYMVKEILCKEQNNSKSDWLPVKTHYWWELFNKSKTGGKYEASLVGVSKTYLTKYQNIKEPFQFKLVKSKIVNK